MPCPPPLTERNARPDTHGMHFSPQPTQLLAKTSRLSTAHSSAFSPHDARAHAHTVRKILPSRSRNPSHAHYLSCSPLPTPRGRKACAIQSLRYGPERRAPLAFNSSITGSKSSRRLAAASWRTVALIRVPYFRAHQGRARGRQGARGVHCESIRLRKVTRDEIDPCSATAARMKGPF